MPFHLKVFVLALVIVGCSVPSKESSETPELVDTRSRPTNKQWKGVWAFKDSTIFFSNDFEGGRLNGLIMDSVDHFTGLITGENYPINPSPWYAFKVWSKEPQSIQLKLTYTESRSRYYPKVSKDGYHFKPMDTSRVKGYEGTDWGIESVQETIEIELDISNKPIWVAAQELWTSTDIKAWIDSLSVADDISNMVIGSSIEGRPIRLMEIGDDTGKGILIISRQHPPEVTGFLAMKSFIETIAGETDLAKEFRTRFKTYNVPLMNPDGVDNGFWRHNVGGIDLNRDWQEFNQPETSAVRDFLEGKGRTGVEFVFAADFHSTWKDIYYTLDSSIVNQHAYFIYDWIENISTKLEVDSPMVSPSVHLRPTMVSRNYFYHDHDIPSIVFELGDNTKRDFLDQKGRVAAEELMKILLKK